VALEGKTEKPPVGLGGGDADDRTSDIGEVLCLSCPQLCCCVQTVSRSVISHHRYDYATKHHRCKHSATVANSVVVANSIAVAGFVTAANFAVVAHPNPTTRYNPSLQHGCFPVNFVLILLGGAKSCALSGESELGGLERAEKALFTHLPPFGAVHETCSPLPNWEVKCCGCRIAV